MKISEALQGVQSLYLDTAPFIYFIEAYPVYVDRMRNLFHLIESEQIDLITSVLTLTEVLTKPLKANDKLLETTYRDFLTKTRNLNLVSIDAPIAAKAAQLRAAYNLKTPDAIQIASALETSCDGFLTNDLGLRRVLGIQVLILDELDSL